MLYKQLGNTGLFVSEFCLGIMTFGPSGQQGRYHDIAGMDQLTADSIVEQCIAAGVNFFDTPDVYTQGQSERMLGQALKNLAWRARTLSLPTRPPLISERRAECSLKQRQKHTYRSVVYSVFSDVR